MVFGRGRQVHDLETQNTHLRMQIQQLTTENAALNSWIDQIGVMEHRHLALGMQRLHAEAETARQVADQQIQEWRRSAQVDLAAERQQAQDRLAQLRNETTALQAELTVARNEIVETRDIALLQESGVYEYQHPLDDAVAYKAELARIKDVFKALVRRDQAVTGTTSWMVDGSRAKGDKMVKDFSKLMLRAYNAEADNLVRTMRPHKLQSSIVRLEKTVTAIERLGAMLQIRVNPAYHHLRVQELGLTADHLAKTEEEKERIRAEREQDREEEKARREFERARERLLREQSHVQRALARLEANGDETGAAELRAKLDEVGEAINDVEAREANIRTGYVYVISNIGAFGERMIKIGMTRRLDPMDRVRELGDASVPFRFDVHALIFSADALGLESGLHAAMEAQRVNRVNRRREFFYATPAQVRAALESIPGDHLVGNHLLEYREEPEAAEWRASSP
ncbi:DUF4041 domain-containing protein [Thermomonospora umbrina]|uniref:T5orf172 domain-containing protein n=1 Tax=Thermomonospora umbrina TaxID=111806 RepID=A0A3D9SNB5_9ACTN|nr:DUF4041 domain-containing protein [Thermomonospora umbrina]REE97409.1 T5orf172 domain-containing protein [Thermomonospora umbrina]